MKTRTFFSIIKSSLLKLLYTITRLCEGTPPQPHRLNFFGIEFPLHPYSQLPFITFCGKDNRGKVVQIPWVRSAPQLSYPQDITPPTTSNLYYSKISSNIALRHFALSCASGRTFLLRLVNYFLRALTLLWLWFFCDPSWLLYPLGDVTWTAGYLE